MKILHVLNELEMGGIQRWVANLTQVPRPKNVQLNILTLRPVKNPELKKVMEEAGCKVFGPPPSRNPLKLYWFLRQLNTAHGPYDIVHAHLYLAGGVFMGMCRIIGIPIRIQQIHSIMSRPDLRFKPYQWRFWARPLLQTIIGWGATHRLAVSDDAGRSLFGTSWPYRKGDLVVPPAIPSPRLLTAAQGTALCKKMGLPENAIVLGHIGRLMPVKNQAFLIHLLAGMLSTNKDVWLVIVGDGPLKSDLQKLARKLQVAHRIIWMGNQLNATDYLQTFNVFILPSISESFSLAAMEAQATGIPTIASTGVPYAPFAAASAPFQHLGLNQPHAQWVSAVHQALAHKVDAKKSQQQFNQSPLAITNNFNNLLAIYSSTHQQ